MQIDFSIGTAPATFQRSRFTGKSSIKTGEGTLPVTSALAPGTHFHIGRTRAVAVRVAEHDVVVESTGPPVFRAFVPLHYRILVDGEEVATRTGY